MRDYANELKQLNNELSIFAKDLPLLRESIDELECEAGCEGFWDDANFAQTELRKLATLKVKCDKLEGMLGLVSDCALLIDWRVIGESTDKEVDDALTALDKSLTDYRKEQLLNGQYDNENAILTLHAGSGGDEACDFTEMILRAILRWAEMMNFRTKVAGYEEGTVAGIASATLILEGDNAYGYAKALNGVFRLVRVSPFDAAGRRHTSFMAIDVVPEFADVSDVVINPDDIVLETMTAHVHAGGQSAQHNNTGIRITHKPSGIVIRYDVERSQLQNRNAAMEMLKARLKAIEVEKQLNEINEIRGEKTENGWGSAICSIVLMPYQLVKDTRTKWESSNTNGFLNGELNDFIQAYLGWINSKEKE